MIARGAVFILQTFNSSGRLKAKIFSFSDLIRLVFVWYEDGQKRTKRLDYLNYLVRLNQKNYKPSP